MKLKNTHNASDSADVRSIVGRTDRGPLNMPVMLTDGTDDGAARECIEAEMRVHEIGKHITEAICG